MQEVWYASTNKMASLQKKLNLQNLIYCQCFEAEVIVDQHDFKLQPNYARTKRLWVKSTGVELTTCMFASSSPALDHTDFIQKSHVRKDKRLDIS